MTHETPNDRMPTMLVGNDSERRPEIVLNFHRWLPGPLADAFSSQSAALDPLHRVVSQAGDSEIQESLGSMGVVDDVCLDNEVFELLQQITGTPIFGPPIIGAINWELAASEANENCLSADNEVVVDVTSRAEGTDGTVDEQKERRRAQYRRASKKRRIKKQNEDVFVQNRIGRLSKQLAALTRRTNRGVPDDEHALQQQIDAHKVHIDKLRTGVEKLADATTAILTKTRAPGQSWSLSPAQPMTRHLPVPFSASNCHRVARQVHTALVGDPLHSETARVNVCYVAGWRAELWTASEGRLNWKTQHDSRSGRLEVMAGVIWELFSTEDAWRRADPSVLSVRILARLDDNYILLHRVIRIGQTVHEFTSLTFCVAQDHGYFIGATTLPGSTGGSECHGWMLSGTVDEWTARWIGYCDIRAGTDPESTMNIDALARSVLLGLRHVESCVV